MKPRPRKPMVSKTPFPWGCPFYLKPHHTMHHPSGTGMRWPHQSCLKAKLSETAAKNESINADESSQELAARNWLTIRTFMCSIWKMKFGNLGFEIVDVSSIKAAKMVVSFVWVVFGFVVYLTMSSMIWMKHPSKTKIFKVSSGPVFHLHPHISWLVNQAPPTYPPSESQVNGLIAGLIKGKPLVNKPLMSP